MSLSRAFTTRRLRGGSDLSDGIKTPRRSNTTKTPETIRHKISAPVQLLHTTNMLSYNAPDIPRSARSNSTNSLKSASDADSQTGSDSTPPTSPDIASTPQPNHLSCYFKAAGSPPTTSTGDAEPPAIPKRSPSHTKKNSFDAIALARPLSNMSRDSVLSTSTRILPTFSRSASTSTRASSTMSHVSRSASQKQIRASSPIPTALSQPQSKDVHPFGQELAQVTELAEENHDNDSVEVDEEHEYLVNHGLQKVSADDYLSAIQGLSAVFFPDRSHGSLTTPLWI